MSTLKKSNGKIKYIPVDWDDKSIPENRVILEGSPIGEDGCIHNDKEAFGILKERKGTNDGTQWYTVIYDGEVNREETERISGIKLTREAIKAMSGISFK